MINTYEYQYVLDFPLPTVGKQLKSFFGTVNYLRDFVRNHSTIVKPLHNLIATSPLKSKWYPLITDTGHSSTAVKKKSVPNFISDRINE